MLLYIRGNITAGLSILKNISLFFFKFVFLKVVANDPHEKRWIAVKCGSESQFFARLRKPQSTEFFVCF